MPLSVIYPSNRFRDVKRIRLTVDGIVIKDGKILLVKRAKDPFKGRWALPGGFVEYGEKMEEAVTREVKEETGLDTRIIRLFGVYSDPERDPRGHTVSIVYCLKISGGKIHGGDDASEVGFFPLSSLPELAFDHADIISDYRGA